MEVCVGSALPLVICVSLRCVSQVCSLPPGRVGTAWDMSGECTHTHKVNIITTLLIDVQTMTSAVLSNTEMHNSIRWDDRCDGEILPGSEHYVLVEEE